MATRRNFSSQFKVQVGLPSLRGEERQAAMCRPHGISADLLSRWRHQCLTQAHRVFADPRRRSDAQARTAALERLVGP